MKRNVYEDLTQEDLLRLAVGHTNRGQKIPSDLMTVLEDYKIAEYFKDEVEELAD